MAKDTKAWFLLCGGFAFAIGSVVMAITLFIAQKVLLLPIAIFVLLPGAISVVLLSLAYREMNKLIKEVDKNGINS